MNVIRKRNKKDTGDNLLLHLYESPAGTIPLWVGTGENIVRSTDNGTT